jgi:hypothetical protein
VRFLIGGEAHNLLEIIGANTKLLIEQPDDYRKLLFYKHLHLDFDGTRCAS